MSISAEQEISEEEIEAYVATYREQVRIEMERVREENEKRQWGILFAYENDGKFYCAFPGLWEGTMTLYEAEAECERLEILHRKASE